MKQKELEPTGRTAGRPALIKVSPRQLKGLGSSRNSVAVASTSFVPLIFSFISLSLSLSLSLEVFLIVWPAINSKDWARIEIGEYHCLPWFTTVLYFIFLFISIGWLVVWLFRVFFCCSSCRFVRVVFFFVYNKVCRPSVSFLWFLLRQRHRHEHGHWIKSFFSDLARALWKRQVSTSSSNGCWLEMFVSAFDWVLNEMKRARNPVPILQNIWLVLMDGPIKRPCSSISNDGR